MYAVILAGGVGSRLWPRSRNATPKQFLNLAGHETMIQTTVRRIMPLIPADKILVVTGEPYVGLVGEQLPMLPPENVIAELSGKNTAPAIGLGALAVRQRDPTAVMAVLTADHLIPDEATFRSSLSVAEIVAQQNRLVTLGITPTGPETGYGYIQRGDQLGVYNEQPVYQVQQFLEKPDLSTAEQFFQSGEYYWNSGMFIWRADTLFQALERHMPELAADLARLDVALQNKAMAEVAQLWQAITPESIDVGLMEKAARVAVVPLDAGWNDVGSWSALYDELAEHEAANVVVDAEHLNIDAQGLLIQGNGKLVATVGLDNVVIVVTDDAILVCAKDRTQDVKKIVDQLKQRGRQDFL